VSREEERRGRSKKWMRVVMKFGGRAVADGARIKTVAQLIKRFKTAEEERKGAETAEIVTVTSALSTVTDALLEKGGSGRKHGEGEGICGGAQEEA
jgi:aspartokinase